MLQLQTVADYQVIFNQIRKTLEINEMILSRILSLSLSKEPIEMLKKDPLLLFISYGELQNKYARPNLNEILLDCFWTTYHWRLPPFTCFLTDKDGVTKKGFWYSWNDESMSRPDLPPPTKITDQEEADDALYKCRYEILGKFFKKSIVREIMEIIPMKTEFPNA